MMADQLTWGGLWFALAALLLIAALARVIVRLGERGQETPAPHVEASAYQARCRHLIPTRTGQVATCNAPARRRDNGWLVCDEHAEQRGRQAS